MLRSRIRSEKDLAALRAESRRASSGVSLGHALRGTASYALHAVSFYPFLLSPFISLCSTASWVPKRLVQRLSASSTSYKMSSPPSVLLRPR